MTIRTDLDEALADYIGQCAAGGMSARRTLRMGPGARRALLALADDATVTISDGEPVSYYLVPIEAVDAPPFLHNHVSGDLFNGWELCG